MIAINMEMPKSCSDCNMTTCKGRDEPWNYVCSINLKDIDFNETERAEHCPLTEIVNCKDCKHKVFLASDNEGNITYMCDKHCENITDEDFYCSDGERRE